jgi:hypothetical protein
MPAYAVPILERGLAVEVESVQKRPGVEGGGRFPVSGFHGEVECPSVAPHPRRVETEAAAGVEHRILTEVVADVVQGVGELMPGLGLLVLAPKDAQQLLPGHAAPVGRGKHREDCELTSL